MVDFSSKNFKEFCEKNNLSQDQGKTVVLERIDYLLNEISKLEKNREN